MQLSTPEQILAFLKQVGDRLTVPATIYIFGGSALLLAGSRRNTDDLDYSLESPAIDVCRRTIAEVAAEFEIDAEESIPAEFMPLPAGADERHQLIGQYGLLRAFMLDPYSMAVMKVDRAFESDLEDVRFLLKSKHIDLARLESSIDAVARRYDEPLRLRRNLEELKRGLG